MERCKGDFYVSLVRNLRFSRPSCTFSAWETYGSASGNVECGSRFVSLCRWILLFLCGDVSGGKLKNIKTKKHRQSSDYQCFLPVGVTGFEPATTRPPEDNFKLLYFYISLIYRINITINQMLNFYNFSSIYCRFPKNVSYLCHSNKRKIIVLYKS